MNDFNEMLRSSLEQITSESKSAPEAEPTVETTIETTPTSEVETNNQTVEATPTVEPEVQTEVRVEPEVKQETKVTKKYATEQVEELNHYLSKNPDKTLEDYLRLKQPIESSDKLGLIKEWLSEKEGLTEAEIKLELKKMEVKEKNGDDDFDFDDDDEVKNLEAEALLEKKFREAKSWKEQYVSEQLAYEKETSVQDDLPVREQIIKDYNEWVASESEKTLQEYYTTAFQSLNELKEYGMTINGETVQFDLDDDLKSTIKTSLDTNNIVKQFFDDNGKLVNTKDYFESLMWMNKTSRDKLLAERDKQVEARVRAETARTRKNVTLDSKAPIDVNAKPDLSAISEYLKRM